MDCSSSSVLGDDDFTLDGTSYTFNQILLNTDNAGLLIGLLPALTVSAAELTLMVDGTAFAFEDGRRLMAAVHIHLEPGTTPA